MFHRPWIKIFLLCPGHVIARWGKRLLGRGCNGIPSLSGRRKSVVGKCHPLNEEGGKKLYILYFTMNCKMEKQGWLNGGPSFRDRRRLYFGWQFLSPTLKSSKFARLPNIKMFFAQCRFVQELTLSLCITLIVDTILFLQSNLTTCLH